MNERTYNKPKLNPTENLEEQIYNLLRADFFPRYKFQLSYFDLIFEQLITSAYNLKLPINIKPKSLEKYVSVQVGTTYYVILKMDVLQLAAVFENFVQTSTEEYGINPLYGYSLPSYTWEAGLKLIIIKLDFIKDKHLLLLL